jgi:aminopeptidase YwaD
MDSENLIRLEGDAQFMLHHLCRDIPNRRVGSPGNIAASDFIAHNLTSNGFEIERQWFDCIDWIGGTAKLEVNSKRYTVYAGPYSLGCEVRGKLVILSSLMDLETLPIDSSIVLVCGDLVKEQLMPKNFPFYNPEEHQHIYRLLEQKKPLAILAATTRNPELAGGVYPYPWIEDGDFDIPSAYMTEEIGVELSSYEGQISQLYMETQRIPVRACNVIGRIGGGSGRRIVLTAHLDAKRDTPGALDNAAGVTTLLLLSELLVQAPDGLCIELVFINGEDYYAASGEIEYLRRNQGRLGDILLNINLDALGYRQDRTAYSLYECPGTLAAGISKSFECHPGLIEGSSWYQGDHMIFVQNQVPALAITSEEFNFLSAEFTHTEQDVPELVDPLKLVDTAAALKKLLYDLTENINGN